MKRRTERWLRRIAAVLLPVYGIVVRIVATKLESVFAQAAAVTVAILLAALVYIFDSERRIRRLTDDKAETILSDFIFPNIEKEVRSGVSDELDPSIRVNVMLYRRRALVPRGERKLAPWKKSLKIDFSHGDYDDRHEDTVKWLLGEGICGNVLKDNEMIAEQLDVNHKAQWNMTTDQYNSTDHINSLICVPIYLPEDEEKERPVGVLNVDTESQIQTQKLQELAEELRPYASYVGMLV